MKEGSPEEEASESPQEAMEEGDTTEQTAKVSPDYQERCDSLVEEATIPELDYIISMATDMKKKMMKSQNKAKLSTDNFSTEGMPS